MSGIGEYFISEEEEQQQQSSRNTDALSITIDTQSEMNLTNIIRTNLNDPTLIYKISFGFICAFLCLLTITGNFLVLITFRRIRRVSIS